ncbi:class I SAM-dependent methyltransferase [Dictyobacter alpinus]|nr:class I SAM-dependent methyltransferase [Dictyobacter alpinus]
MLSGSSSIPYRCSKNANEIKRLDFQHFILRTALGGNYLAPIGVTQQPHMILDVGSGTNFWGCEIARDFPETKIYGLDIELVTRADMPANYRLIQGDIRQDLPFAPGTFDYIHQRFLISSLTAQEWPIVISRLLHIAIPGGWIELVDASGEQLTSMGPMTAQLMENMAQLATMNRSELLPASAIDELLQAAGAINVHKKVVKLPVGKWGGRIGSLMATNLTAVLQSFKEVCMAYFHYSSDYFDGCLSSAMQEWDEYHLQYPIYICFGQKL